MINKGFIGVNMKKELRLIITFLFLAVFINVLSGQNTAIYKNPEADYRLGVELFNKEKYGAARTIFSEVISSTKNTESPLRINAEYYDAVCALELYNKDAGYKLNRFILYHPTDTKKNLAYFQLGRYNYRNKKYKSALKHFEQTETSDLTNEQKGEYFFKTGYCYFKAKDFEKSKTAFDKAISFDSKYASPAKYYLAHLAYENGDYNTALAGFQELGSDPNFKAIVPYYIVQILFMKGEYEKVTDQAPPLLKNASKKRAPDLARIIGESYYKLSEYEEALPYLERYSSSARSRMKMEDLFILGFVRYKTGNYDKAIKDLQQSTGGNDSISQYAWYYLGGCYLETDQKKFAANAFNQAFKLPFDKEIREDALFNYAKLTYDLSFDPYNTAINALKEYLNDYPNSSKNDEAYTFLYKIALSTGKYDEAMFALEKINNKGGNYNNDLQKTIFMLGTELFNKMDYEEAIVKFKKAAELNADKKITSESMFWIGEAYYRLKNYQLSFSYYKKFLDARQSKSIPTYNIAFYNIGYIYFKRKEYANALNYFKKFLSTKPSNLQMTADADLRAGDSYFVMKQYDNAIEYYDKGIKMQALDVDYALYQKALALGVLQRYNEKIIALNKVINGFPNSSLYGKSLYELGNTYLIMNKNENALVSFKRIIKERPTNIYSIKAQLKSGLIYYNGGQNDLALMTFKKVVSAFPGTPESKEALASIRNIYIDMNRAEDYFAYAADLSFANVTPSEQDSVLYIAAENQYLDGNTSGAITSLAKYLEKFPEGAYKMNAEFYLAECLYREGKKNEALKYYTVVLAEPQSGFTETALYKAATISYGQEDYTSAAPLFARLEGITENPELLTDSRYWQMKSYLYLKDYENALASANRLLSSEKLNDNIKLDALMIKAKAFLSAGELALAEKTFNDIVKISQGEKGAEAKYNVAEIEFILKNNTESEKLVFELVNNYSNSDYWVAKGFILLGDIYTDAGNVFQAKQTFQSIIDNYDGDDLTDIAMEKLDKINVQEQEELNIQKQKDSVLTIPDTISIKGEGLLK